MLIKFDEIMHEFGSFIKNILHLGAHLGEEYEQYQKYNKSAIWIEGNHKLIPKLQQHVKQDIVIHALLSNVDNQKVKFNISSNGQSSSVLNFGSHKKFYPHIKFIETQTHQTQTMKTIIEKNAIDMSKYNFVNLDLQGVELNVLQGFGNFLDNIDFVYTEVNTGDVYQNCNKFKDLQPWLENRGFKLHLIKMTNFQWGDALFVKTSILTSNLPLTTTCSISTLPLTTTRSSSTLPLTTTCSIVSKLTNYSKRQKQSKIKNNRNKVLK